MTEAEQSRSPGLSRLARRARRDLLRYSPARRPFPRPAPGPRPRARAGRTPRRFVPSVWGRPSTPPERAIASDRRRERWAMRVRDDKHGLGKGHSRNSPGSERDVAAGGRVVRHSRRQARSECDVAAGGRVLRHSRRQARSECDVAAGGWVCPPDPIRRPRCARSEFRGYSPLPAIAPDHTGDTPMARNMSQSTAAGTADDRLGWRTDTAPVAFLPLQSRHGRRRGGRRVEPFTPARHTRVY